MKHEVPWNKYIIDCFIKYGNLNDEQIRLMQLRCSDHSDFEIADELKIGVNTYYRRVRELKKIYDEVQLLHPELDLPKREMVNEKIFEFFCKENAIDMINYIDFEKCKLEMKIIRKKNKGWN